MEGLVIATIEQILNMANTVEMCEGSRRMETPMFRVSIQRWFAALHRTMALYQNYRNNAYHFKSGQRIHGAHNKRWAILLP